MKLPVGRPVGVVYTNVTPDEAARIKRKLGGRMDDGLDAVSASVERKKRDVVLSLRAAHHSLEWMGFKWEPMALRWVIRRVERWMRG